MSLLYRDASGNENPVAGLNGLSGETLENLEASIATKGGKLYLHKIQFRLKSIYEMKQDDSILYSWRENDTTVVIGVHRRGLNSQWEELLLPKAYDDRSLRGKAVFDIKVGDETDEYSTEELDRAQNKIYLDLVSRISAPFTSKNALATQWRNNNILSSLTPKAYTYSNQHLQLRGFSNDSSLILYKVPEVSGSSFTNYVDRFNNGDEEVILALNEDKIAMHTWTDTVTEWN